MSVYLGQKSKFLHPHNPKSPLTRNSVADLDEDFLKVSKVIPGRLKHVHEAIDEQVLHPAEQGSGHLTCPLCLCRVISLYTQVPPDHIWGIPREQVLALWDQDRSQPVSDALPTAP